MMTPDPFTIQPLTLNDYDAALELWLRCEGVRVGESDSCEAIARYLERNPGLSLAAHAAGRLAGTILAGHDGHRGMLYHLAVEPAWRRRGLGRRLVERAVAGLAAAGIGRCYIHVLRENEAGKKFWAAIGWENVVDCWSIGK